MMCAAQCGRQLLSSPDVRIVKSERALGVLEDKHFHKEGAEFREHSLRRCAPPARARRATRATLGGVSCRWGFQTDQHVARGRQLLARAVDADYAGPQRQALRCVRCWPRVLEAWCGLTGARQLTDAHALLYWCRRSVAHARCTRRR
jgi:hypothetical protein